MSASTAPTAHERRRTTRSSPTTSTPPASSSTRPSSACGCSWHRGPVLQRPLRAPTSSSASCYPEMVRRARTSSSTRRWAASTPSCSSSRRFTMALGGPLGADQQQEGARAQLLLVTIACACIFLVVKYFEYTAQVPAGLLPGQVVLRPPSTATRCPSTPRMFFAVYFMMTGLHGVHVLVGIGVLIWIFIRARRREFSSGSTTAGRDRRALLAPRRPRLDLPLPAPLPGEVRESSCPSVYLNGKLVEHPHERSPPRQPGLAVHGGVHHRCCS